jgi:hypothetical protein
MTSCPLNVATVLGNQCSSNYASFSAKLADCNIVISNNSNAVEVDEMRWIEGLPTSMALLRSAGGRGLKVQLSIAWDCADEKDIQPAQQ